MLLSVSRFFVYLSAFAPVVVCRDMFFPAISAKSIYFRVVVELALAGAILHVLLSANRNELLTRMARRLSRPLTISVGIFTLLFITSTLTAVQPTQAFWSNFERGEGTFQVLHYFIFFVLIVLLFADPARLERLLAVNILASFLVCLYALGQRLGLQAELGIIGESDRLSGTLGNPSYLAAYLLINFAFLIFFFPIVKTRFGLFIAWVSLFAFEMFIFLNTGTRGAMLAFAVGLTMLAMIHFRQTKSRRYRLWFASSLALALIFALTFLATHGSPFWKQTPIVNRAFDMHRAAEEFRPRWWTWGSAVRGVLDRPLTGWGAGNFAFVFDKHYNPENFGHEPFTDRTHNVLLEYLITGGVPLLITYLAIFVCCYRLALRHDGTFWRGVLLTVPVVYLIQGFFLFDVLPVYLVLYLFLALALHRENPDPFPAHDAHTYRLSGAGLSGILVCTMGMVVLVRDTALHPMRKNLALVEAIQSEGGADAFKKYEYAHNLPSPVGQEEVISSFCRFANNAIESNVKKHDPRTNIPLLLAIRSIVDAANRWYDDNPSAWTGAKDSYLNGWLNLNAGLALGHTDYIARGNRIFNDELAKSPNRVELLQVLLVAARSQGDDTTYHEILTKLKNLRPDVRWERGG